MTRPHDRERTETLPVGVVLRRAPGVTRWAAHSWRAIAVLPGAGPGRWTELRREGEIVDYHAATVPLELFRAETESYLVALNGRPPSVYAILRKPGPGAAARPEVVKVTASAYEAQDYGDNGEDIVEPVPMPPGLEAWIGDFCRAHHKDEAFVKRRRQPHEDRHDEGRGDARVRQPADVYRAPGMLRRGGDE
ncbi:DUF3305 domain-containing protein [Palleronia sediminis]|uniref:DUF3305 domain-containing protein n=1 Tax=Palleronia sediminis TaxID=2547833 RepID=UPI001F116FC1|nr:DUF3305 domain-containing protein [Palleronia sediminis]